MKALGSFREFHSEKINFVRSINDPPFLNYFPLGYFDGACQELRTKCHDGSILKMRENHIFLLKMGCGMGTNICGELLGA